MIEIGETDWLEVAWTAAADERGTRHLVLLVERRPGGVLEVLWQTGDRLTEMRPLAMGATIESVRREFRAFASAAAAGLGLEEYDIQAFGGEGVRKLAALAGIRIVLIVGNRRANGNNGGGSIAPTTSPNGNK